MKKDIEWLREEVYALYPSSYSAYVLKELDKLLETEIVDKILELIDQLDKPEIPTIPQFVADYIELNKGWSEDRQEYVEGENIGLWFALNGDNYGMSNSVSDWLFNEEKVETFARAWLYGFEVEKEQLYAVKVPNADSYYYGKFESGRVYIGSAEPKCIKDIEWYHFTKKDALTKLPDIPKKQWIKLEDL